MAALSKNGYAAPTIDLCIIAQWDLFPWCHGWCLLACDADYIHNVFFFGFSQCACPNNSLVLWIVGMSCHGSLLVPMMTLHISCSYVCPVDDLDYINDIPMHAVLTTTPSQWTSCLVLLSCYLCIPLELCYVQIVCCIISTNYKYLSAWCWIGPFYSAQE